MKNEFIGVINKIFNKNRELGFIHGWTEDEFFDGKNVTIRGKRYTYYGSCSYLGVETDARLKQAAIEAVQNYGTQFSCSRTFLQMGLYEEVEELLGNIFEKPVLLAPTTSLGHISTIPILIGERDAIVADQQVHNSVRNAIQMCKGDGVYVETIKHNRMDMLENRIQILRNEYEKVWYFADGVYSMYGDAAPFNDIRELLNQYEQFHFYVDDAHGMGWAGKNGRGLALQNMAYHPRMIVTSSLAKGFGNCGGVLAFYDEEQKQMIRNCGSSFIFSGPLQPAILGGIKATAQIFLTDEIENLQSDLSERMIFFITKCKELGLPLISDELTPIFYIGVGNQEVGFKLAQYLMDNEMYCNLAQFPAVSLQHAGLRVVLTRHHTLQDINKLLTSVAKMLPVFMQEENYTFSELLEAFGIKKQQELYDILIQKSA